MPYYRYNMTTGEFEIRGQFAELQRKYKEYLPKVDPELIDELLLRQMENPSNPDPIFMVEVFTRPGLDTEKVRRYIIEKTGMSPAIYDNGTHYVTNQKLNLKILKEISDSDDVLEVTGEYTGGIGAYGASHEHREIENTRGAASGRGSPPEKEVPRYAEHEKKTSNLRIAVYTAAGIIGAVIIAGWVISGGMLPNANVGGGSNSANTAATIPGVPGAVHGFVAGPGGLPAIGASVIAAEQNTGHHANAFVSVNGQYFLDLPPGNYVIIAAYPDGTNRAVNGFVVGSGSEHRLDFAY
ncbi:carboxypeptidase-like regulatory domain-containing protein [Candidatus Nitrososphaera evergladensis]|nr:carboxypeptidase-like regulatory domain-containing protein [Candidatus Nitrososphaera evergladensis]